MKNPEDLRRKVEHYLKLKRVIADQQTVEAINELVAEYEAAAEMLERRLVEVERFRRIRDRAYRIWEENGRPDGLHDQHWRAAEDEERENNLTSRRGIDGFSPRRG